MLQRHKTAIFVSGAILASIVFIAIQLTNPEMTQTELFLNHPLHYIVLSIGLLGLTWWYFKEDQS